MLHHQKRLESESQPRPIIASPDKEYMATRNDRGDHRFWRQNMEINKTKKDNGNSSVKVLPGGE